MEFNGHGHGQWTVNIKFGPKDIHIASYDTLTVAHTHARVLAPFITHARVYSNDTVHARDPNAFLRGSDARCALDLYAPPRPRREADLALPKLDLLRGGADLARAARV